MSSRLLHSLLFLFAFLFAQAGAGAHAVSHLPQLHDADKAPATELLCDLCVGYAALSGSAPLPDRLALSCFGARHEVPLADVSQPVSRSVFFSRARAPPVFS